MRRVSRSLIAAGVVGLLLAACSGNAVAEPGAAGAALRALKECVLNWAILATLIPAFFLAALIKVAVPSHRLLRCLGPQAGRPAAYGAALGSGTLLSLCSCNIMPLFGSIWRSGAGAGPAFCLLYAGPAVNVVAVAYVCKVLGFGMGLWLVAAAAIAGRLLMGALLGLAMETFFPSPESKPIATIDAMSHSPGKGAALTMGTLMLLLITLGFVPMTPQFRLAVAPPVVVLIGLIAWRRLERDLCVQWLRESGAQMLRTLPKLAVAALILGLLGYAAQRFGWSAAAAEGPAWGSVAAVGGTLMYFPMLADVALVKSFGWGGGAAVVLLLAAPGLSLPAMLTARREVGLKRVLCYVALVVAFAFVLGMPYGLL